MSWASRPRRPSAGPWWRPNSDVKMFLETFPEENHRHPLSLLMTNWESHLIVKSGVVWVQNRTALNVNFCHFFRNLSKFFLRFLNNFFCFFSQLFQLCMLFVFGCCRGLPYSFSNYFLPNIWGIFCICILDLNYKH